MNKKLQEKLQDAVKDCGLSKDAISALIENASKGVADDASDDDITKIVENYTSIAKIMQGETTRKVQAVKNPSSDDSHKEGKDDGKDDGDEPAWFKKYQKEQDEKLQKLLDENEKMKAEKSAAERSALISTTAKKLGIPDYLMKHVSIKDDEDIEKTLGEYKQDLVNNSLLPKDSGEGGSAKQDKQMEEDAEAWAKTLPDANPTQTE
jgi:ribosomal protein L19E